MTGGCAMRTKFRMSQALWSAVPAAVGDGDDSLRSGDKTKFTATPHVISHASRHASPSAPAAC